MKCDVFRVTEDGKGIEKLCSGSKSGLINYKDNACYELYRRMIELRRTVPAFAKGGRKVLLADGRILAVARFLNGERYLGIISMEDEEREVTIPVWEIGATGALGSVDEFGMSFDAESDNGDMTIKVPAFGAYIIKLD